jgi:hypothetical protein
MKLGILAAAAAFSVVGVTSASAQVCIADPYLADFYAYVAPPVYAAPPPVYAAPAARVVTPPPIGGYAPPKYSYTVNSPRYGVIYSGY